MQANQTQRFADEMWDDSIIPQLQEYIKIPNKSPLFDPDWEQHGYMDEAVALMQKWCEDQAIEGMTVEVVRLPGRTPLLFLEIPGASEDCVLLYGHLDKQPEFSGWAPDLDPWTPVIKNGRLYGRGGADDGYAVFASLTAIKALHEQSIPHARCVVMIEACEESGSFDLPYYVDLLNDRIGTPSLVICLDAECGNYDQLWCTTSLRGNLVGTLSVQVLEEGVHSGAASGIVASSFRVVRSLLSRIEDHDTGRLLPDALHASIPKQRQQQAEAAARVLGDMVHAKLPFAGGTQPLPGGPLELMLNNTWRPTLSVTGADGLPALDSAGNVLRPGTPPSSYRSGCLPPATRRSPRTPSRKRSRRSRPTGLK